MNKDMTQDEVEQARPRSRLVWIAVAALLVASAAAVIVALVWPGWALPGDGQGSGWALSTPEEQAMDAAELEAMTAYIDEHDMQVDSIVVVRHGRIVFEEYGAGYAPDKKHPLYSMTKSVTSMLVGIAIDAGTIEGLDVPVTELLPETTMANLDARKERMTLEHLLAMSDGIDWREHEFPYEDSRNIVNQMGASADAVQFVLDRPMAREPGEAWAYNSGASILMGAILEEATGRNLVQYAREVLFDPIASGRSTGNRHPVATTRQAADCT
jgi:CubicO group peptidase (beta-lactamase class C family)